jgi:hypothetical protein
MIDENGKEVKSLYCTRSCKLITRRNILWSLLTDFEVDGKTFLRASQKTCQIQQV